MKHQVERSKDYTAWLIEVQTAPEAMEPIYVKAWRTIVFAPPKAAAAIKAQLATRTERSQEAKES